MEFVDRVEETQRLTQVLEREKPGVVAIYGRRRIGKSELIKRVLKPQDVFYLADRSEGSHQRVLLAKMLAQTLPDFDKVEYPDWETLLRAANYRTVERFALCLDEFPYLVEQSPELPSVFQKLIDEKQLNYDLVFCGSSQNMMYGTFLDASAPLYGRADAILKLNALRIPYLQEALNLDPISAVEEYAVWGGVPRYWELREALGTFDKALWDLIFSTNGLLYEEPLKLFLDDVKNPVKTSTIMSYIGAGAQRLSEIASRCNEPATNLSRPLKKLIDLGFIHKDVPFGTDEKSSKKSLYKISDPLMDFYFKFVVPNRSFIELGRTAPIQQALNTNFSDYLGGRWEQICRDAVSGNDINGTIYGKARRWWGSVINEDGQPEQIEIDLVAESLDKKRLLVGERKWTTQENGKLLTSELTRKSSLLPFAKGYEIVPILFLKTPAVHDVGNALLPQEIIDLYK